MRFEAARLVFDDPRSLDDIDDRFDYGEHRFNITGMAGGRLLTVTYTDRNGALPHHLRQEGDTT